METTVMVIPPSMVTCCPGFLLRTNMMFLREKRAGVNDPQKLKARNVPMDLLPTNPAQTLQALCFIGCCGRLATNTRLAGRFKRVRSVRF
jgi:hypothetical protein